MKDQINANNFIEETTRATRTSGIVIQTFRCASCKVVFASEATSGYAYLTDQARFEANEHLREKHAKILARGN